MGTKLYFHFLPAQPWGILALKGFMKVSKTIPSLQISWNGIYCTYVIGLKNKMFWDSWRITIPTLGRNDAGQMGPKTSGNELDRRMWE